MYGMETLLHQKLFCGCLPCPLNLLIMGIGIGYTCPARIFDRVRGANRRDALNAWTPWKRHFILQQVNVGTVLFNAADRTGPRMVGTWRLGIEISCDEKCMTSRLLTSPIVYFLPHGSDGISSVHRFVLNKRTGWDDSRFRGWGPTDPSASWLVTEKDMTVNRGYWRPFRHLSNWTDWRVLAQLGCVFPMLITTVFPFLTTVGPPPVHTVYSFLLLESEIW